MTKQIGSGRGERELKVRVKDKKKTPSQKAWLQRQLNDPYVARAKKEGWRSRAAYAKGVVMGLFGGLVLALMPLIAQWRLGHRFNVLYLWSMLAGVGVLTALALKADRSDPEYARAVVAAQRDADRVVELARSPEGIPVTGAVTLLRNDPLTQGPRIFAKNCASCHRHGGHDGLGGQPKDKHDPPYGQATRAARGGTEIGRAHV